MKFVAGTPKPVGSGRAPGTPNKRTQEFQEVLAKHNFNAAEAYVELYNNAREGWQYGNREEKPIYLRIAADLLKEMASRVYPRLSSVELKQSNMLDGMTPEQKLEAMKQAVAFMEGQIKDGSGSV